MSLFYTKTINLSDEETNEVVAPEPIDRRVRLRFDQLERPEYEMSVSFGEWSAETQVIVANDEWFEVVLPAGESLWTSIGDPVSGVPITSFTNLRLIVMPTG